ncbi:MAG: TolC family protein [Rikenellaceae bacterium]|jgi:outer membrane protein TolC
MKRWLYLYLLTFLIATPKTFSQEKFSLEDYLAIAKKNSPLLNDYNNKCFLLKIDSLKLRADYGLHVSAIGDASYSPDIHGWGYNGDIAAGHNLAAIVQVSKEILSKENLNAHLANYSLAIQQLINQSQITEIQLNQAITEQYINVYAAQQKYMIVQEIIKLLEQEDEILKKLTRETAFKQTEYLSFKVTLQQNILALQQEYNNWQNEYSILNYLSGIVDTTLHILQPQIVSEKIPFSFEQSVYADKYRIDSLKLANDGRIINYEYRPKLKVYVDCGYSSAINATPYKNFGARTGVSINIPIYDGSKRKMSIQQNQLELSTLKFYSDFQRNQYQQQSAQIIKQIQQYKQMKVTATEQLKYSKALIEANMKQLPAGDVKVSDFILSINNYINLKTELVQYEASLYNLYNHLHNITLQ